MEVVGVVVAIALAVGGWIASGILARRDARSRLRVEFLISAYRRLDRVSNRPMSQVNDDDIESAISDIQLFGSPATIELADGFATSFAEEQTATTTPLLEALRKELRGELRLPRVAERSVWLRLDRTVDWSSEALVVRQQLAGLPPSVAPQTASDTDWNVIDGELARITDALSALLASPPGKHPTELARAALDRQLISAKTERAVRGISVMRDLAAGRPVNVEQVRDFTALVSATLFAIESDSASA